ncbi:MAG TPA: ATP-binding protein, partial [Nitrospiria bacterium]
AMPGGGTLEIHAARTTPRAEREDADRDRYIRIELADTGVGIARENLDRIFDPFFSTKEAGKGTGLGLSVSASIVRSHHGRISVRSRPGELSVFTVFLPISPAAPADLEAGTGGEHG